MNIESERRGCPDYEAKLEDFLSGELSGTDKREVAEHLKSCASCKAAMADAEMSARLLRLMEASADPGPAFSRIVMARIRSEQESVRQPRGFWQPFVSLAWRFAATATLALVVMVTYDVTSQETATEPNDVVAQSTQIHDLFPTDADHVSVNRDDVLLMQAETEHGKR